MFGRSTYRSDKDRTCKVFWLVRKIDYTSYKGPYAPGRRSLKLSDIKSFRMCPQRSRQLPRRSFDAAPLRANKFSDRLREINNDDPLDPIIPKQYQPRGARIPGRSRKLCSTRASCRASFICTTWSFPWVLPRDPFVCPLDTRRTELAPFAPQSIESAIKRATLFRIPLPPSPPMSTTANGRSGTRPTPAPRSPRSS